jgi:hypothetical protein
MKAAKPFAKLAAFSLLGYALQAEAASVLLMGLGTNQADLLINQSTIRHMRPGDRSPA